MTDTASPGDHTMLSPDEAFNVLGNETRIEIVRALGEAGFGESLSFTELRERVGVRQGAQFNYHLDKLVGHFVTKTDEGYALRPAGHRVIEAILSQTVTGGPAMEPAAIDHPCPYCGSPTEMDFHQQRVYWYCPECPGTYGDTAHPDVSIDPADRGYLGMFNLPPGGLADRGPEAVLETARIWMYCTHNNKTVNGLCPRCSSPLVSEPVVCPDHDTSDGLCEACNCRHAVKLRSDCGKCTYHMTNGFAGWLLTSLDLVEFLVENGVNPLSPAPERQSIWIDYDTEVLSVEPFEARFTFTIDGDALTLTVNDDLNVTDTTRRTTTGAA